MFPLLGEVYSKETVFPVSTTRFAWLIKEMTGLKPGHRLGILSGRLGPSKPRSDVIPGVATRGQACPYFPTRATKATGS